MEPLLVQELEEEISIEDIQKDTEFLSLIDDLISNPSVQEMKKYRQHYDTSCYDHCLQVSYYSYLICKKLDLDYRSAARGGMLHDLFLYNWRKSKREVKLNGLHAFVHPKIALYNSMKLFNLNEKEKDIIVKHMWPVTLSLPRFKESYVITFVDKYSAIKESIKYYRFYLHRRKVYRYAYVFFSFICLKLF